MPGAAERGDEAAAACAYAGTATQAVRPAARTPRRNAIVPFLCKPFERQGACTHHVA